MSTQSSKAPVIIIGAGIAGLAAATELLRAGHDVRILDKGRGVGGRLATRRIGGARLDHGAQFFTVRGDTFRAVVDDAIKAGIVEVWCHGFGGEDGHPRYYCPVGMTSLAKWVAESIVTAGGQIDTGIRVTQISNGQPNLQLDLDNGDSVSAQKLIVTSPVPQTLDLLDAGNVLIDDEQRAELDTITYAPTIGLLATLDRSPNIDPPGGVNNPPGPFSFVADNAQKGISAEPAVTLHLKSDLSSERWDQDADELRADLISLAKPWLGSASIVEAQVKKWRYATPIEPHTQRCVTLRTHTPADETRIVLAGDAFGGPKVEGAFNSGFAAAAAIVD